MENQLKIGELAERTGCQVETIRFYERKGLLTTPERSQGNYRLYDEANVMRLQFIRNCRSLDMTLEEIRTLLTLRDQPLHECTDVNSLLDEHIGHVNERIKELKGLQSQLKQLRSRCSTVQSVKECGILQELDQQEDTAARNLGSHAGGCH